MTLPGLSCCPSGNGRCRQLQTAAGEVDEGAQVLEGAEPARPGDGGLDRGVGESGPGVRVARRQPVADPVAVGLNGLRQSLERRQAGASAPAKPAIHPQHHRHLRRVARPGCRTVPPSSSRPVPCDSASCATRADRPRPGSSRRHPCASACADGGQRADLVLPHLLQRLVGQLHQREGGKARRGVMPGPVCSRWARDCG